MPQISGYHHIGFNVRDLARSVDWYTEVLGLTKLREIADDGERGAKVICVHPASRMVIGFTAHRSNAGEAFSEFRTGMDHFAFAVSSRAELEAWKGHFEALGVDHSPIKQGATGELITFRDPDNIQLEVYVLSS
jgi:glyoxylase I family protein